MLERLSFNTNAVNVKVGYMVEPNAPRYRTIAGKIRRREGRMGAQAFRSHCWHGRTHAEAPGLVPSSTHDRAVTLQSDNYGLAPQTRIITLLDRA
jgi:hypothetical protein